MKRRLQFGKLIGMVCLIISLSGCGKEKNNIDLAKTNETIKWVLYDGVEITQECQKELNNLLKEKGFLQQVEFVTLSMDDSLVCFAEKVNYEEIVLNYLKTVRESDYDIISLPGAVAGFHYYPIFVENNMLEPLDFYKKSQKLQKSYPKKVWNSLSYNGRCYGLLSTLSNYNCYLVINQKILESYGLHMQDVTQENWSDIAVSIYHNEQNKGNCTFVPVYPYGITQLEGYEDTLCNVIKVYDDGKKIYAVNLLKEESFCENLKCLYESKLIADSEKLKTLGTSEEDEIKKGNFFAIKCYSYSSQAAKEQCKSSYQLSDVFDLLTINLSDLNHPFMGWGAITGVSSASKNKECSASILEEIYSSVQLSNLLVYGREGIEYQLINERIMLEEGEQYREFLNKRYIGNSFLLLPNQNDSPNRAEELFSLVEEMAAARQNGIWLDSQVVSQQVQAVNEIYFKYLPLLQGQSLNWREEFIQMEKELEGAGIQIIIDEWNQQLKEQDLR